MRLLSKTLAVLVLFFGVSLATPQKTTGNAEFDAFWKSFKTAIAKNDKQAIADLTKLPFLFDSKERDRAGFLRIYPQLFTPKMRRCIASAKLVKEQENYDVFCGELIFYFGKDTDGKYKFLEFGVND